MIKPKMYGEVIIWGSVSKCCEPGSKSATALGLGGTYHTLQVGQKHCTISLEVLNMLCEAEEFRDPVKGIIGVKKRDSIAVVDKFDKVFDPGVNELFQQICSPNRGCVRNIGTGNLVMRDRNTCMNETQFRYHERRLLLRLRYEVVNDGIGEIHDR